MKTSISLLLLAIFSHGLYLAYGQCSYFDIVQPDPYTTTSCGSKTHADPTDLSAMPAAGTKQLTATVVLQVTDLCGNTGPLAVYTINAYTGSIYTPVLEIKANSLTSYSVYITDTVGTQEISQITTDSTNAWLTVAVSFDFDDNKVSLSWMSKTDYVSKSITNVNFGSWIFKSNLNPYLMDFAYDTRQTKYVQAKNQKATFGYTYEENLYPFIFGVLAPTRIGSYTMLENTGYQLTDTGSVGTAYFGASTSSAYDATYAPSWTPTGVLFTDRNQYITMPSVSIFKSTNPLVSGSVSLSFMLRVDEIFTGTIFSRISTSSSTVMALKINAYGKLQTVMSDTVLTTSTLALVAKQWIQVTVFYMYSEGRATASISFEDSLATPGLDTTPLKVLSSFTESGTDVFKIGGFKGSIRNLGIYGSGSPRIVTSTCSTCVLDMGATVAACVRPACASTQYVSGQTCQGCSASCLTCGGAGANACVTCPGTKVLSSAGACEDPPATPTTPTTPTTNSTNNSTDTSITVDVEVGTGFDTDVIVSIVISLLSIGAFVAIVIKIAKKKAMEAEMSQVELQSPELKETNLEFKGDSFY